MHEAALQSLEYLGGSCNEILLLKWCSIYYLYVYICICLIFICEGCSKSNTSYFIMLACDLRVWRWWSMLPVLAGLCFFFVFFYYTYLIVQIWCLLFVLVKDGLRGYCFPSNNAIIAVVKQWVNSIGAEVWVCHAGSCSSLVKMHN